MLSKNYVGEIRSNVSYDDFAKVFKVFSYAPFFEDWSSETVSKVYNSFSVKHGCIFGYYYGDECVGLLTLRPIIEGEHPVSYPSDVKVMYLSDVATLPEYRGKGIGTQLFLHALRHSRVLGYDFIYLRTNEKKDSMSYKIAEKCGFKQIWDLCQEVEFPRTRAGHPTKDLRIFMEKKL